MKGKKTKAKERENKKREGKFSVLSEKKTYQCLHHEDPLLPQA